MSSEEEEEAVEQLNDNDNNNNNNNNNNDCLKESEKDEEEQQEVEITCMMSNAELKRRVLALIPNVDLSKTGLKQFVKLLSQEVGLDLKDRKEFIKDCLMQAMDDQEEQEAKEEQEDDDDDNDNDDEEEQEEEEEATTKSKTRSTTKTATRKKRKRKSTVITIAAKIAAKNNKDEPLAKKKKHGGGGFVSAMKQLSPALASFLGKGDSMARTEIVKALWDYIRKHELQNPDNRQEILLDEAMQNVFGCTMFTMFTMSKYISAHIDPFTPVDLTKSKSNTTTSKSGSSKETGKKKAGGEKKRNTATNTGFQAPYHLSETLQAVVGTDILPRGQVVAKIWEYIRLHELQNPKDKREIVCDDKLKKVMGGQKKVTMFNMNKHLTKHILEKAETAAVDDENDNDNDNDDNDNDEADNDDDE